MIIVVHLVLICDPPDIAGPLGKEASDFPSSVVVLG